MYLIRIAPRSGNGTFLLFTHKFFLHFFKNKFLQNETKPTEDLVYGQSRHAKG